MKKLLTMGIVLLSAITLSACGNDKTNKTETNSHISSKAKPSAEKIAKNDVDALFDDSNHTKLLDGTTSETITDVKNEVNNLKKSDTKTKLLADIEVANKLWPEFKKNVDQKNAAEDSKMSNKASSEEASEAAASSKAAAESSEEAAASSSKAVSKTKSQEEYVDVVISMVSEMHDRIDGVNGISEKVNRLSKSPNDNKDTIKKEIVVLNNVIKECEDNYVFSDDFPANKQSLMDDINRFWELSQDILASQKQLLKYLTLKNDTEPDKKTYTKNVNEWNQLYKSITK